MLGFPYRKWGYVFLAIAAFVSWAVCFYPWFGMMEQESFFCFLPGYAAPFFSVPGGPAEFAARFFIQFFRLPYGAAVVHLLLVSLLAFWVFRYVEPERSKAGPAGKTPGVGPIVRIWRLLVFGVFLSVYWIFAYNGLKGFTTAIAWLINVGLAWGSLCLCTAGRKIFPAVGAKSPQGSLKSSAGGLRLLKGGKVDFIVFPVVTVATWYLTGPLSVFYVLAVSVFRPARLAVCLPVLFISAFVSVTRLVYTWPEATGLLLLRGNLPVQNIVLGTALVLLVLGIIRVFLRRPTASFSLAANRPSPIDRYGTPAFIKPLWGIPLLAVIWTIPCLYAADPLERTFFRSEKYASEERWEDIFRMASGYFERFPEAEPQASYRELRYRELLAVNLKAALLKSGRLNRQFLSYGNIPEMNLFMPENTVAGNYHFPAARFAWKTGLFVPMRIYVNNILNVNGLQNAALQMVIPNSIFLERYDLAANYLYYQRHTLFYREEARYWQYYNTPETSPEHPYIAQQRTVNNDRMQEEGISLDFWAEAMYTPRSEKDLLEYHTFLKLFYKELDSLPVLVQHYRRAGFRVLPEYLQEGLLILQEYDPVGKNLPRTYAGYTYTPSVLSSYSRAWTDRELYRDGKLDLAGLQARHGFSYFFHYYFRSFIYR